MVLVKLKVPLDVPPLMPAMALRPATLASQAKLISADTVWLTPTSAPRVKVGSISEKPKIANKPAVAVEIIKRRQILKVGKFIRFFIN